MQLLAHRPPRPWLQLVVCLIILTGAAPAARAAGPASLTRTLATGAPALGGVALRPSQAAPDAPAARDLAPAVQTPVTAAPRGLCGRPVHERFYTPVTRFPSLATGLTWSDLRTLWTGAGTIPDFSSIYPDQAGLPDLIYLLGKPGPAVKPQPSGKVADAVWSDPHGLGLLPFDALTPRLRALALDGQSLTDNHLDPARWPLVRRTGLDMQSRAGSDDAEGFCARPLITNRDPNRLTVLVMTGVTAMARGTGAAIERYRDDAWPARLIGANLAQADITTMNNEIPFMEGCVVNNGYMVLRLCSDPAYYAALELSGIDLVGLTGNHLNDFGTENATYTFDLYREHDLRTYGGGADEEAAKAPLVIEDHGNKLAFLGANPVGPDFELAGPDTPGAAPYVREEMTATIAGLKQQGALVFAELQYWEMNENGDYQAEPLPTQQEDFRALLDAGAAVVTGVQAHAPQAVEFRELGVILYGLGNLYFDQTWSWPTRTGLVVRHTIYDGKLINTELLVTYIKDDMQLRWATPEERVQVLNTVFRASGW